MIGFELRACPDIAGAAVTDKKDPFNDPRGRQSEELALRAEQAWSARQPDEARRLFAEAAALEEQVAREVPPAMVRVRGVLAISAVALWYKAGDYAQAKRLAYVFLAAEPQLSDQGRADLEDLVDRCSREAELGKIVNDPAMIAVEVKLDGGLVGKGVAPAAATRRCRDNVTVLLMRSAELEAGYGYRERGESSLERTDVLQIYEVPARAASYDFGSSLLPARSRTAFPPSRRRRRSSASCRWRGRPRPGPDAVPCRPGQRTVCASVHRRFRCDCAGRRRDRECGLLDILMEGAEFPPRRVRGQAPRGASIEQFDRCGTSGRARGEGRGGHAGVLAPLEQ